jgi:putative effector of murein hydrolase LrgA (UPF0299 family)
MGLVFNVQSNYDRGEAVMSRLRVFAAFIPAYVGIIALWALIPPWVHPINWLLAGSVILYTIAAALIGVEYLKKTIKVIDSSFMPTPKEEQK